MRWLSLVALFSLFACDNSTTANEVANIGWSFNYRDWTKDYCQCTEIAEADCDGTDGCSWDAFTSRCLDDGAADCTVDDIRACDNEPTDLPDAPTYPPVTLVHVLVEDPEGVVADWDKEFDCALGENGETVTMQGSGHREYELTLEGFDADGNLLYDFAAPLAVDYSEVVTETYDLRTPLGDLTFDVDYPDSGAGCADTTNHSDCAANEYCLGGPASCDVPTGLCPRSEEVAALSYTVTAEGETTPAVQGSWSPACDPPIFGNVNARTLELIGIPSDPAAGGGSALAVPYLVKIEALDDAGDVLYCGTSTRAVSPGANTRHDSQPLTAGDCAEWSCDAALFDAGDGCDCDCALYDPDCDDFTPDPVNGCVPFSVCAGQIGSAAECACMTHFGDVGGDCVWAGDPIPYAGEAPADKSTEERGEICTWMVNYAGGWGYEHDCGGTITIDTGGISQCMNGLVPDVDPACSTTDIQTCYDAIKAADPTSPVANLCLISTHADCADYRTHCEG